ncbi:MAG: hypothetical protein LC644_03130, partial [Pseudonocardia sp.]|nr:hypothetical protein [Pseudonocardia sp.]
MICIDVIVATLREGLLANRPMDAATGAEYGAHVLTEINRRTQDVDVRDRRRDAAHGRDRHPEPPPRGLSQSVAYSGGMGSQHRGVAGVKFPKAPITRAAQARAARRQRSDERRAGVRDAAARLFLRDGYLDTTMA